MKFVQQWLRTTPFVRPDGVALGASVWTIIALAALSTLITLINPRFATLSNLANVLDQSAILWTAAMGSTFILLLGSIDLSIEGVMALSSVVASLLVANNRTGLDLGWAGALAAILVGGLMGLITGTVHVRLRIPSFLASLGMWSVGIGTGTLLYGGVPVRILDQSFRGIALESFGFVPRMTVVALLVVAFAYLIQQYTRLGRHMYVVGGGEDLAKLSGIRVDQIKIGAFALAGLFYGIAGVLMSARVGVGSVNMGDGSMLFAVLSGTIVGGTLLTGGVGSVLRSIIGVLFITVLSNGMILTGVNPYIQPAVHGVIVVAAVAISSKRGRILGVK